MTDRERMLEQALRWIDLHCDHYTPKTPAPYRAVLELIGNRARVALANTAPDPERAAMERVVEAARRFLGEDAGDAVALDLAIFDIEDALAELDRVRGAR